MEMSDWAKGLPLRAGENFLGLYQPSPETAEYWEGVTRHEFLIKTCRSCGKLHHPRRILCSDCGEPGMDWVRASGRGKVYSFSEIHRTTGVFSPATPYVVGIVELEEGLYIFTRFLPEEGAPDKDNSSIRIGSAVNVEFQVLEQGMLLPVFRVGGE